MLGYWPYAGKQNIFYFIFFDVSTKTGYFHTRLVSLLYKKYKQILINNASTNFQKNTYLNNSLKKVFRTGQTRPTKRLGRNQPNINGPTFYRAGLSPAQNNMDWLLLTVQ